MKKNIIKTIIIFIFSFCFIINAKAAACAVSISGEQTSGMGYNSYHQKCGGYELYCLDDGWKNVSSGTSLAGSCEMSEISSPALTKIYNTYKDYYSRQVAYRAFAYRAGNLSKYTKSGTAKNIYNAANGDSVTGLSKSALDIMGVVKTLTSSYDIVNIDGLVNFQELGSDPAAGTITVKVSSDSVDINKVTFTTDNGTLTRNGDVITVSGIKIKECKGGNVTITASGTISDIKLPSYKDGKPTHNPGEPRFIWAKCPNKQNYILEFIGDGSGVPEDIVGEPTLKKGKIKNTKVIGSYETTVPDPNCDCSGDTNLHGKCGTDPVNNYYVKDSENITACITSGNYTDYCGKHIEKTNDTNKGSDKKKVADHKDGYSVKLHNNYCRVYCREEIEYQFPGIKEAKAGGYFKLEMSPGKPLAIRGTRTCYTDKIKQQKFKEAMREKQKAVETAVNSYLKDYAIYKAQNGSYTDTTETLCTPSSCDTNGNASTGTAVQTTKHVSAEVKYKQYTFQINSDGQFNDYSSTEETYQHTYYDHTISQGSAGAACSKSGNAYTCGTLTANPKFEPKSKPSTGGIKSAMEALYNTIAEYKSCFEWENNYCFNPILSYSYDEVYNDVMKGDLKQLTNTEIEKKSQFSTEAIESTDIANNGYNPKTNYNIVYVNEGTEGLNLKPESQNSVVDITNMYVAKSSKKEATFETSTKDVYSYHPYGTILTEDDKSKCIVDGHDNCSYLGKVMPVALQHEDKDRTIYNYYIDIKNVGAEGDDASCPDKMDRINDGIDETKTGCSLYSKVNKEKYKAEMGNAEIGKIDYVCQYKLEDCPQCTVDCECPPNSTTCYVENHICKYKRPPKCTTPCTICIGCLHTSGNSTFGFKQISLNKIFPNTDTTKVGYNWNTDPNVNKEQATEAAQIIREIEDNGEKIYEMEAKMKYSFRLSPSTMAKIRRYNDCANKTTAGDCSVNIDGDSSGYWKNINRGGYNNSTLLCQTGGVKCDSTFLMGLSSYLKTLPNPNKQVKYTAWK